ncbi:hypothetical protein Pmani_039725 [Petrolisthes manimaculis]|uniref:Uncharacterized protein n=1 Tax=Petrolisthes manimaculis TaxID=1843537 RepID=A0AAE1NCC2_9EUCA|nr:hypothetical protein Pmani_039725 [Petrolisthes manimaculis]
MLGVEGVRVRLRRDNTITQRYQNYYHVCPSCPPSLTFAPSYACNVAPGIALEFVPCLGSHHLTDEVPGTPRHRGLHDPTVPYYSVCVTSL